jgi:hypothetical protein
MKAKTPEMDLIIKKIGWIHLLGGTITDLANVCFFHFNKLLIFLYEKIVFRTFDKKR